MENESLRSAFVAILFVTPMVLLAPAPSARAASIVVNSTADTTANGDGCTLREAIINANNNAQTWTDCAGGNGADTVTFGLSGTIRLGSVLPEIMDAAGLTVDGVGKSVTISGDTNGDGTGDVRLLIVHPGASLTLQNLTFTKGYAGLSNGAGAMYNSGTVSIVNCTFSDNYAPGSGGAIYSAGPLDVSDGIFSGNHARTGGAIYNIAATLVVTNTTFSGNIGDNSGGDAGAIFNAGTMTITNGTFTGNSTTGNGGGIDNAGTAAAAKSAFSGNSAIYGGGISSYAGAVTVTDSTFSGNTGAWGGGGIQTEGGTLVVVNSTFKSNSTPGYGGGIYSFGALTNSTFNGNSAAIGGGISASGTMTVTNVTLAGNTATLYGSNVYNSSGILTLRNTIIASTTSADNCSGTITNGGDNIDSGTTCNWASNNGSMSSTNPLLNPLANNGGPTQTMALQAGSPAIDAGNAAICALAAPSGPGGVDQRGVRYGGVCDIGAFELNWPIMLPALFR